LAIRNGGPDNITCIVADVVDESGPFPPTRTKQLAGAAANGDAKALLRAATGHTVASSPDGAAGPSLNGRAGRTADDGGGDEDEFTQPRRRWPLVTSILVVLVLVIAGGLFAGYRLTQGQYYLAKDGGQISIFRGINEKIAFISLSSVYMRTGVPVSHLPGDLSLPTTPTTLAKSQATVTSIKRSYTCKQQNLALATWNTKYGTPPHLRPGQKAPVTPPKPVVPAYCQTLGAG
jgi:protein phosphatase